MYIGNIGKTHGEIKLAIPSKNVNKNSILSLSFIHKSKDREKTTKVVVLSPSQICTSD